jgi:hypothetical protein
MFKAVRKRRRRQGDYGNACAFGIKGIGGLRSEHPNVLPSKTEQSWLRLRTGTSTQ